LRTSGSKGALEINTLLGARPDSSGAGLIE